MRTFRLTLAIALLATALKIPGAVAQNEIPDFPFRAERQSIVDAQGRVVLFRGVNLVNKFPPYTPAALGFGENDARLMAEAGWNVVRLGVLHSGVEPAPGKYDEAYLDQIAATVDLLSRFGIFSLLDFHQDLYGPVFHGDGLADWATLIDGLPLQPSHGFPNDYFELPAVQRAFDHLWKNSPGPGGIGLQDRYAAAWRHVAARFASNRWVMGYDLFNEPFPGSDFRECQPKLGCPGFDARLGEFMKKIAAAIREVDGEHMIFIEPPVLFDFGLPSNMPVPPGDRIGFSFHDYWPKDFSLPVDNAIAYSRKSGAALFLTEFGASIDPAPVAQVVALADLEWLSWVYWAYANKTPFKIVSPGLPATPEQQGIVLDLSKPRDGGNLNRAVLEALTRPYPVALAGHPIAFGFDPASRVFRLRYLKPEKPVASKPAVTLVALPASIYPQGYRIEVSGAKSVSEANAKVLRLQAEGTAKEVNLRVLPK